MVKIVGFIIRKESLLIFHASCKSNSIFQNKILQIGKRHSLSFFFFFSIVIMVSAEPSGKGGMNETIYVSSPIYKHR